MTDYKKYFLFLFIFFLIAPSRSNYQYPIEDPIDATFTFTLVDGRYNGWKTYVKVKNEQLRGPEGYHGARSYPVNYFFHPKREAPLVFLLVGLGGSVRGNGGIFLANKLYASGYHVVILPSTFTDEFLHTVSTHHYVGQARLDALDQYRALKKVKREIKRRGVRVSHWNLVGYSYGAAVGSFVAAHEKEDSKPIGIKRYVLINPPIDLLFGLQTVDNFAQTKVKKKYLKLAKVVLNIFRFRSGKDIETDVPQFFKKLDVPSKDLKFFIGQSLRGSLGDIIFYTQEKLNLGIIRSPTPSGRKYRAKKYGLYSYVNKFMGKFYSDTATGRTLWRKRYSTPHYSLKELQKANSLYSLEKQFRSDERVFVIHNQDDFLLSENDQKFLESSLGRRFYLYPRGGHLGNIWYEENIKHVVQLLRSGRYH